MMQGLHHIGVKAADIDRSIEFYKSLGFAVRDTFDMPGGTKLAFLYAGSAVIELIGSADAAAVRGVEGVVAHIALEVKDFDSVIERLKGMGIQLEAVGHPTIFGGSKNVFFSGPDGERLELFEEGV